MQLKCYSKPRVLQCVLMSDEHESLISTPYRNIKQHSTLKKRTCPILAEYVLRQYYQAHATKIETFLHFTKSLKCDNVCKKWFYLC